VTESSSNRIRETLAGSGQFEAVTVTLEEDKTGFPLHRRDVTADSRCGDA
jgi:hypothetical protein